MLNKHSRTLSFLICLIAYLAAIGVACVFVLIFRDNLDRLWLIFSADIVATLVIFGFSVIFRNSSIYDPYWSVAPPLIMYYWIKTGSSSLYTYLMFTVIVLWSVRLTWNWGRGWRGLLHEDWRYIMLREKNPKLFPVVNLSGIHLFPTFMVFMGMLPAYVCTNSFKATPGNNFLLLSGFMITLIAILIEMTADEQMRQFKKMAGINDYIQSGLWKYSRHPNYFGEILFWFGLWLIQMAMVSHYWWTALGFIAMFLMFWFVSIPMMESKNIKNKSGYANYIKDVSRLLPMPSKNRKDHT